MDIVTTVTELGKLSAFVMPIVMGLVFVWGQLGAKGKVQLLSSLATGLVVGGGLGYLTLISPTAVAGLNDVTTNVVASGIYGLITGLTASGVYNVGKELATKGYELALRKQGKDSVG